MPAVADVAALLDLAQNDLAADRPAAAQEKCLRALAIHHHHPEALGLLGRSLFLQEQYEAAVRVFNSLTVMQPEVAEHWRNLAAALRPTKRYDQAIAAFDRALRLAPPSAGLLYNLGVLQMERCDYNAAYLALRDAVKLAPTDATTRWGFAQCCYDLVNVEESLAALQNWQELEGINVDITVRIAFLLVMLGATEKAWPAIRQLVSTPPHKAQSVVGLASILERLHHLEDARMMIDRVALDDCADEMKPQRLLVSAVLAGRAGQHEDARRQLKLALDYHQEFVHRYHLLYRLAKVEDALGRFEEAYSSAQEAHRSQLEYLALAMGKSAAEESRILARAVRGCDPEDVAQWGNDGPATEDSPVFVVGFPRSGTTLLEQVLDAHPALQSMDEQPFILTAHAEVTALGIAYPQSLRTLTAQQADQIRAQYWERVREKVSLRAGQRLVDKNPLSMLVLPLIRRLFPNTRIILAIRHPCDVLLSCFLQNFRAPELALLCRDLPTLAEAYRRAFEFWYSQAPLLRPMTHELRYEQLTGDFSAEVRKLATFLELSWNDAMLAPAEQARCKGFVSTPSYAQILEPVNTRSVGRWQHYERHFAEVLPTLAPWIERWGYDIN